jgi:hypothetical protein
MCKDDHFRTRAEQHTDELRAVGGPEANNAPPLRTRHTVLDEREGPRLRDCGLLTRAISRHAGEGRHERCDRNQSPGHAVAI